MKWNITVTNKISKRLSTVIQLLLMLSILTVPVKGQIDQNNEKGKLLTSSFADLKISRDITESAILNKVIFVQMKDVGLLEALNEIASRANLKIAYNKPVLDHLNNRKVTLDLNMVPIHDALWKILEGTDLAYAVSSNRNLVIFERSTKKAPSTPILLELITGQVTDAETNETLPGVNIVVKGTTTGTSSDANGEFDLNVPSLSDTLVFSFIGYESLEVPINGRTEINAALQSQAIAGDELVVVGYGTVRKTDLTGAVSTVDTEDFERVPAVNPLAALQGRTPGLRITPNSGEPGAGASIRVRGEQSISGTNSPIFVVDGSITTSIDNLNSNDIASVSVLKDASAVAIYGSRAANGVILITTKRGIKNTAPSITFHSYAGIQQRSNLKLDLLNAQEYKDIYTEAYTNSGITPPWSDTDLATFDGIDTDWQDEITDTGTLMNYDLSVSGGSERSNYYVAASHINNQGMVINTDYNRTNLKLNTDHRVGDWITFGNSLNLFSGAQNSDTDQYHIALQKAPVTKVYEDDGGWGIIQNNALEHIHANPVWLADNVRKRVERGLLGNLYLTVSPIEGLEFTARGNVEWSNDYRSSFDQGVPSGLGWEGSTINNVAKDNRERLYWSTDFLLDYERQIGADHRISGLLGYSVEEQTFERLWGDGSGTPNNEIQFLSAADPTTLRNDNTYSDWGFSAVFGRLGYTFKDRYIVNATVRRDGTSRLDKAHRYGVFPSVSVAWRMSEERFMDDIGGDWLNELKLRASYGTVGNVLSISNYGTKTSLSNWNYVLNQDIAQGYTLASAVNTDLVWESTEKRNIGIDAELFNNRFRVTADFFIEDTYDLLFRQPIPSSTGLLGSPFINAGQIQNTGIEMALGYRNNVGDWSYSIDANFTTFKNDVIDLEGRDLRTSGIEEGYPMRSYFGYQTNGLIRSQADLDNHPHLSGKEIGDIWLKDVDGDGEITPEDRTIIGDNYPNLTYGLMGTVGYKNLTLQVQLQGIQGITTDIRGGTNQGVLHYFTSLPYNHAGFIRDRYHPNKNPNGSYPMVKVDDAGNNLLDSDFWLFDASFLRVSNVNLNYQFPASIIQNLKLKNLGAYVSVQNLYTFTDFYGPEVDSNADELTGVPQPRTWLLGLKVGF